MLRYIYSFPEKVNGAVNNKIIKVEFSEELLKGQCDILTYRYIKKGILAKTMGNCFRLL